MTVSLSRAYAGYAAGDVVQFDTPTETALVQQGFASVSAAVVTAGARSTSQFSGRAAIPAGQLSVVISNPSFTPQTKASAWIAQGTADGTLTTILRVVPANGSITIYGNANATAATQVDWTVPDLSGLTPVN